MKSIPVEGGISECMKGGHKHWHADVNFVGYERVSSAPWDSEEDAERCAEFAREVVQALIRASGGTSMVAETTNVVQ